MTAVLWFVLSIGGIILFTFLMLTAFISTIREIKHGVQGGIFLAGRVAIATFFGTLLLFTLAIMGFFIEFVTNPDTIR